MRSSLTDYYVSLSPSVVVEIPTDYMVAYLGVGSTVLGALISGLVSYFIFRRQSSSQLVSEQKAVKDTEYVQAVGVLLALNEMTNGMINRFEYLQKNLIASNEIQQLDADWWQKLSPLPDFSPDQPQININDYAVLIKIGKTNMISSIMELSARFRANEEAFFYANKENLSLRRKLFDKSDINKIDNSVITNLNVLNKNKNLIIEINSIFNQLYVALKEDCMVAGKLHLELNDAINLYFDGYQKLKFTSKKEI